MTYLKEKQTLACEGLRASTAILARSRRAGAWLPGARTVTGTAMPQKRRDRYPPQLHPPVTSCMSPRDLVGPMNRT